jgi:predicted RNA-binding Zn-ribbon protein involved in translation (DUF1610 family)
VRLAEEQRRQRIEIRRNKTTHKCPACGENLHVVPEGRGKEEYWPSVLTCPTCGKPGYVPPACDFCSEPVFDDEGDSESQDSPAGYDGTYWGGLPSYFHYRCRPGTGGQAPRDGHSGCLIMVIALSTGLLAMVVVIASGRWPT